MTLEQAIVELSSGGMGKVTGAKGEKLDITDDDLSLMLKNMGWVKSLKVSSAKGKIKVSPRDKKTYDNYKNLKKAARKALPASSGSINPNNLTALKKVLEAQNPKTKKK
jgi:hypothetical protein